MPMRFSTSGFFGSSARICLYVRTASAYSFRAIRIAACSSAVCSGVIASGVVVVEPEVELAAEPEADVEVELGGAAASPAAATEVLPAGVLEICCDSLTPTPMRNSATAKKATYLIAVPLVAGLAPASRT